MANRPGAAVSPVFVGLALRIYEDKTEYVVVIHDGMGIVGSEHSEYALQTNTKEARDRYITNALLERAKEYCRARGHTVGTPDVSVYYHLLSIAFYFLLDLAFRGIRACGSTP